MRKNDTKAIQVTDAIWLRPQGYALKTGEPEQFNVCVRNDAGELAALEYITRNADGVFTYNDTNIGTLDSPEFAQYIRKFQPGPDLSALDITTAPQNEEELFRRVSDVYAHTKSLKQTAKLLSLSEERTRRVLFTVKAYTCDNHEKVMKLLKEGKTLEEAAELAGIKRNKIHAYLPYGYIANDSAGIS